MGTTPSETPHLKIPLGSWITVSVVGGLIALGGWTYGVSATVTRSERTEAQLYEVRREVDSVKHELRTVVGQITRVEALLLMGAQHPGAERAP